MSYCINPYCSARHNPDSLEVCQACGTPLLIQGRYVLIKPLRALDGYEYSEIFLVDDRGSRKVLKVLKDLKCVPTFDLEDPAQRFEREARTLQKLKHPGIPHVEPDGYFTVVVNQVSNQRPHILNCLVMEYIEGQNLEQWMVNHPPINPDLALEWLKQLIEILDQVHQNELFHRDIKPSNIMLRPTGQLALIDFGSARPMTNTYFAKVGSSGQREITSIVSPGYTPLEQVNGKAVPQSDFYALGRTFVYLLTGQHPISFTEDSETGALEWQDSAPQISSRLATFINDLMAPFPGQRPLNTQEVWQRLTAPASPPAKSKAKSSINWLIVLNVGLLLLQATTWLLWLQANQSLNRTAPESSLQNSL